VYQFFLILYMVTGFQVPRMWPPVWRDALMSHRFLIAAVFALLATLLFLALQVPPFPMSYSTFTAASRG
jgi:hypothetical protein